jgi:hypothetical protein
VSHAVFHTFSPPFPAICVSEIEQYSSRFCV